jgi:tetratricopeptide (TPR) repeat protein
MSGPPDGPGQDGPGGERIPGHEVLGVLGRGGMGVVYKARNLGLKRVVAVKMILAGEHAGPDHVARFRTEAEAIARLQHPNIVQVFEVGAHGEKPFLSLEFCGGGSLATKLAGTPQPAAEAAALVQKLAEAMHYAHERGVVHRDLKPANVLLADDGTPKVTDFGLAKKLDEAGPTMTGAVMGTPSYMAPEQAGGKKEVGPLADLYALGAVLYECLTGRPPFKAATPLDTMLQVVSDEPVPPRRLNPAVPRDLETVCLKCLQKEPGKRYVSAQALANDLQRFLKHEPILARPATARERVAKWCRRNPRLAVVSGLSAGALVVYAVTASVLIWNLNNQIVLKELARQDAENKGKLARENEQRAVVGQNKAIRHLMSLGQALVRNQGQELAPGEPGARRASRENLLRDMRVRLKELSDDLELTRFNQVALHQHTGDLAREICLLRAAEGDYRIGYQIVADIAQADPNNDKARANLAVMDLRLGNLAWELDGDVEVARKHFENARRLRQEIADHPRGEDFTDQQNQVALAYIALDLGRLEFSQGNLAAAREHLARAVEARRAWAKAPLAPDQNMAPSYLSEACMWMGVVLAHQGDQESADRLLQEALELTDALARKHSKEPNYQVDLAEIYGARGDVQALRGDWNGASASYGEAKEYVRQAGLLTAEDSRGQVVLAQTIERLGAAADQKGDAKDARGRRLMSLKVREKLTRIEPTCVSWKAAWLLALAHMDGKADDQAAELAKRAGGNSELLLQLARYHAVRAGKAAVPGERRAAAERGLALVGEAVRAGYADRLALAGDPDLAPLRQEAEFKALLNRLAR